MSAQTPQSQQASAQNTPQSQSQSKIPRVLACVLCQHRKIKCDRSTPCSNCVKANVPCTPSTPAPVRKRRRPNQDLQERLARCEALLKQYASTSGPLPASAIALATSAAASSNGVGSPSPALSHSLLPPPPPHHGSISSAASPASSTGYSLLPAAPTVSSEDGGTNFKPAGKLVVEDGSVKFMDSYLWGMVHENLAAMREILESEAMDEQSPYPSEAMTPDDNVDLLLNDFSSIDLQDVVPSAVQIFRLWQVFLERVNPVTKLVHVPTLQPIVIEAAANHRNVPHNTQALLFSIYLISVVSLTQAETRQMLDMSKDEALKKFSAGCRAALTRSDFLKHYDMVTLQAFLLYLVSLQGRYDRHAAWILSGVLIRIAHKMGLHRDGEMLNLQPFETEMRRRVWWHIVMLDSKYAMTSGFSDTLLPWGWDTRLPSNVNDTNLFPGSTELQPREGSTEMVFVLIIYTIGTFFKDNRIPDFEQVILGGQLSEPGTPDYIAFRTSLDRFTGLIDELEANLIAVEQRFCDPSAGPIHAAAAAIRPGLMEKVRPMIVPMRELPEWGTEVNNVQDNIFRISLTHHESAVRSYEAPHNHNIIWFLKCHFQADGFLFLVGQLYRRSPVGNFADRAWSVIEGIYKYHEELWDMTQKIMVQIGSFVIKAWRARERALINAGVMYDVPSCVPRIIDALPQSSSEASSQGPSPSQAMKTGLPISGPGNPHLDFMSSGFMDTSGLDWDLWTDLETAPGGHMQNQAAMAAFGPFGNFGAPAPGSGW
ncbi:C6 zinc finger domain-containing protein [Plectosphaerella cucumerina]|uniref:C6 zinc finger domain-containing protein n=1 Tax=Plectosphaerella cucumerina TaxID=40658 RepID=A0A8K0TSS4_9PEZI|nr:C6 zinc finger domain-containing protein [Plectosphaerella cucumerina]